MPRSSEPYRGLGLIALAVSLFVGSVTAKTIHFDDGLSGDSMVPGMTMTMDQFQETADAINNPGKRFYQPVGIGSPFGNPFGFLPGMMQPQSLNQMSPQMPPTMPHMLNQIAFELPHLIDAKVNEAKRTGNFKLASKAERGFAKHRTNLFVAPPPSGPQTAEMPQFQPFAQQGMGAAFPRLAMPNMQTPPTAPMPPAMNLPLAGTGIFNQGQGPSSLMMGMNGLEHLPGFFGGRLGIDLPSGGLGGAVSMIDLGASDGDGEDNVVDANDGDDTGDALGIGAKGDAEAEDEQGADEDAEVHAEVNEATVEEGEAKIDDSDAPTVAPEGSNVVDGEPVDDVREGQHNDEKELDAMSAADKDDASGASGESVDVAGSGNNEGGGITAVGDTNDGEGAKELAAEPAAATDDGGNAQSTAAAAAGTADKAEVLGESGLLQTQAAANAQATLGMRLASNLHQAFTPTYVQYWQLPFDRGFVPQRYAPLREVPHLMELLTGYYAGDPSTMRLVDMVNKGEISSMYAGFGGNTVEAVEAVAREKNGYSHLDGNTAARLRPVKSSATRQAVPPPAAEQGPSTFAALLRLGANHVKPTSASEVIPTSMPTMAGSWPALPELPAMPGMPVGQIMGLV